MLHRIHNRIIKIRIHLQHQFLRSTVDERKKYLFKKIFALFIKKKKVSEENVCKKCLSHPISKKSYATIQEALRVGMYKKYEYYNY